MAEASDSPAKHSEAGTSGSLDSPKRGPSNISTSTSSFEAGVQHDPTLNRLAINMFTKTEQFLQGELEMVIDDYRLLAEMNRRTHDKYVEMRSVGQEVQAAIQDLNTKYTELEPYLRQLDEIDESLQKLESVAIKLDAYSKQLEARCKAVL